MQISCDALTGSDTGANDLGDALDFIGGIEAISVGTNIFLLNGTAESGGNSGHHFRLQFELPEGEEIIYYFFTSRSLSGGVQMKLNKTAGKVTMTLSVNGNSDSRELSVFENKDLIDLSLDIHNDHTDIHILVWDTNGPKGDEDDCTFDEDCLYNTQDFDAWIGAGRASGVFWGIEGNTSLIETLEGPLPPISDV